MSRRGADVRKGDERSGRKSKNSGRKKNTGLGMKAMGEEQQRLLRRGIRLEQVTLGDTVVTVALIMLVAGQSQAMKASWIEDALSFLPATAFLIAVRIARRTPHRRVPYGYHRSIGVAHLVASVALLTMGLFLAYDSVMTLVKVERAPVGLTVLFGHAVWQG